MPRSRWQALRLLLVCAVLAFTSAPPRVVLGWFESVVQVAQATEAAAEVAPQPEKAPSRAGRSAPRSIEARTAQPLAPQEALVAATDSVLSSYPNARRIIPVSRLYLWNSALLC